MEKKEIVLDLSDDLTRLIREKKFPLQQKLLEIDGIEKVNKEFIQVEGEPVHRDLSFVIITSSVSFYIVVKAISQLIEAIKGGSITKVVEVLEPVYKPDGETLRDNDGNVIMRPTKQIISGGSRTTSFEGEIFNIFRFKDKTK